MLLRSLTLINAFQLMVLDVLSKLICDAKSRYIGATRMSKTADTIAERIEKEGGLYAPTDCHGDRY